MAKTLKQVIDEARMVLGSMSHLAADGLELHQAWEVMRLLGRAANALTEAAQVLSTEKRSSPEAR